MGDSFKLFRGMVAMQKITIDSISEKVWKYYDYGPKDVPPLVLIPGASGTAEVFYKQFLSLCPKGYRLISVQFPDYMTHDAWCKGLDKFLDKINVNKIHLFGTSLGGYLAQCFVQHRPQRILSLILNNSFSDTQFYQNNAPCAGMFSVMPEFMLKRMILQNFPTGALDLDVANSVDFMVQQLESLKQRELASRLTLNCIENTLKAAEIPIDNNKVTIIDCLDEVAVPDNVREEVYKYYPNAKVAELKMGGNFPYVANADEFNLYIQVHLRKQQPEEVAAASPKTETLSNTVQQQLNTTTQEINTQQQSNAVQQTNTLSESSVDKSTDEEPNKTEDDSTTKEDNIITTTTTTTTTDENQISHDTSDSLPTEN